MRKSKYSEIQIIGTLKRTEQRAAVKDICREPGISSATFSLWRSPISSNSTTSASAWMAKAAGWTMCLSSACGAA